MMVARDLFTSLEHMVIELKVSIVAQLSVWMVTTLKEEALLSIRPSATLMAVMVASLGWNTINEQTTPTSQSGWKGLIVSCH